MTEARATREVPAGQRALVGLGLTARFVLELGMLTAFVSWGLSVEIATPGRVALAVAAPVIAGVIWGRWIAPKASERLSDPARLAVESVLFGLAALALLVTDEPGLAAALVAAYILDTALLAALGRRGD